VIILYIFVVTYNDEHKTLELIEKYREIDIRGATIIETMGSGRYMNLEKSINKPIMFAGIRRLIEHYMVCNRTLYTIIRTKKTLKDAFRITEEVLGDFSEEGKGIMFAVPVIYVKGGSFTQLEYSKLTFEE
jgi:hypothetical protein